MLFGFHHEKVNYWLALVHTFKGKVMVVISAWQYQNLFISISSKQFIMILVRI